MTREVLEPAAPAVTPRRAAISAGSSRLSVLDALRLPMPTDRLIGWIVTLAITLLAFWLRLVNLRRPSDLVFDETYYAKDAWSLLQSGYERDWPDDANDSIVAGTPDVLQSDPSFIVHPQVGKWLIAFGEHLFGMNSFGWRFMPLVFGCLLVLVTIRLVRRVSRSTLVGGIAGLLLTLDGLAFVMSRTALLDIFLAFFLVAAVACLAADRDWFRTRLADHLEKREQPDLAGAFGPRLWFRPWRIAAGVCFGLALGTKWNAIYALAAFALLSLAWDVGARRLAGAGRRAWQGVLRDGIPAFVSLVVLAVVVYVSTWASWLATSGGWGRDWGENNPDATSVTLLGKPLASLLHYQREIYGFHTGDYINGQDHNYDAHPAGWLVLARPIGIDAVNDIAPGTDGCPLDAGENCLRVISGIGTPVLWWAAVACLLIAALFWLGHRDWRFGIPVVGVLSSWLPWFSYTDRPQFLFYAIAFLPFSVMAVALCLGMLLGPAAASDRRMIGGVVVGVFVALVGANFAYLYPVLTDEVLPHSKWLARMWFSSWI